MSSADCLLNSLGIARDFANKVMTGPPSGNGYPNQPGFNVMHREYNDAVKALLQKAEEIDGSISEWSVSQWKAFANSILSSNNPAIKGFLDELEENNPGAKAALAASISAYRVSARLLARLFATAITEESQRFFDFVCLTCDTSKYQVIHRITYPNP